eukprot:CAMPEP_0169154616 /NCGR_PEP_ID=MMETSP1015-20121227/52837_1 /TAXON_ID=342587 /ORGANISM="Karlodinium micrum, Strain CCMP2283" /LENGTH=632 /DNA_ID=CAMNT_0009224879 /DNA_START=55 /DNA_END=1948 /DNA_ORIENTATION=-
MSETPLRDAWSETPQAEESLTPQPKKSFSYTLFSRGTLDSDCKGSSAATPVSAGQLPTPIAMERDVCAQGSAEMAPKTSSLMGRFAQAIRPPIRWRQTNSTLDLKSEDYQQDHFDAARGAAGAKDERKGMFIDASAMKEKLRQNMNKPKYDVKSFYHRTGLFQHIASHRVFEGVTLGVIAFNALWISIDTDYNHAEMLVTAEPIFQIAEQFFCAYFSFEWFCRFMAFKKKRNGFRDAWFVFDSIMVLMMVLETWVMTFIMLATGVGGSGGMGNASILRLARLLRLSRMARMARLLRAMPELMILIKGMVAAMRSVFFTMLLLALLDYVFAILFTQLTAETVVGDIYFYSVPKSMHTLLLDGTLLDNVGTVVRAARFSAIFYIFVLLAALTVMNMLIGVLCEVVSAVAKLEMLQEVGVDPAGLIDVADFIFEQAENDKKDQSNEDGDIENRSDKPKNLTFGKFMEHVLQMRGTNMATVKDIVDFRKFVSTITHRLKHKVDLIQYACDLPVSAGGRRRLSCTAMSRQNTAGSRSLAVANLRDSNDHDLRHTAGRSHSDHSLNPLQLYDRNQSVSELERSLKDMATEINLFITSASIPPNGDPSSLQNDPGSDLTSLQIKLTRIKDAITVGLPVV